MQEIFETGSGILISNVGNVEFFSRNLMSKSGKTLEIVQNLRFSGL